MSDEREFAALRLLRGIEERLDRILAKISDSGLHSLTEAEKRLLRRASGQRGV